MPCGCTSACGCLVVGDGSTADVVRDGDTFIVSALLFIDSVIDTDCIDLTVTPDGELSADLVVADAGDEEASVQMRCTGNGIAGDVVLDPASTAPVSLTSDGLRVDLPPPDAVVGGGIPGDLKATSRIQDESGWLDADGSEVSRGTFSDLHDAVSSVTVVGSRVIGSGQITNAKTRGLGVGMSVEATDFGASPVIVSIDGPFAFTVSNTATSSGADTEVRAYPYGNGDGATTFNLPLVDENGYVVNLVTATQALGEQIGTNNIDIQVANLPSHDHPGTGATDAGHQHNGNTAAHDHDTGSGFGGLTAIAAGDTVEGEHTHTPPPNNAFTTTDKTRRFVVVGNGDALDHPLTQVANFRSASLSGTIPPGLVLNNNDGDSLPVGPAPGGGATWAQGTSALTAVPGAHKHRLTINNQAIGFTTNDGFADITVDVAPQGDGDDMDNRPSSRAYRWLVKI